jgi:hypothetical protein
VRPVAAGRIWTLAVWATAAAAYVTIGVFAVDFLLSVFVAIAYLLVTTWLVPAAIRRLRRAPAEQT